MDQPDNQPQPITDSQKELTTPAETTHKSLKLAFIAVSALIICASATYAIFPEKVKQLFTSTPEVQEQPVINQEETASLPPASEDCTNNTIKTFGQVNPKKDILLYKTECHTYLAPNNTTDQLVRYYIRDADGTFNKLVASRAITSGSYKSSHAFIVPNQDKIEIFGLTDTDEITQFSRTGERLSQTNETDPYNLENSQLSPDKNWEVTTYASDHPDNLGKKVILKNLKTKEIKTFAVDNGLNGIRIASWSADSKTLYLQGGVWEFGANARLWKIDLGTKQLTEYQNLQGFAFPVLVYPEYNIAYVLKDDMERRMNEQEDAAPVDTALYSFSLSEPQAPKAVLTEKAQYAFQDLVRTDSKLLYTVYHRFRDDHELKEFDTSTAQTRSILRKKANFYLNLYSNKEKWFPLLVENTYNILFNDGQMKMIGSRGAEDGLRVPTDSTEYVSDLIGILPAQ